MSRKTRKLMWSVPLIAAVAVIGALAAFVVLSPNGAQAHDEGPGVAAHQQPPPVTGIDVFTPTIANGGRSSLQVSWNAPVTTGANTPTRYRVDISEDTDVWMNVIGGEGTNTTLTEGMATSNCTSSDEGNRCYTAPDLKADTLYHFRVFAMNGQGTSPISVDETIGSGRTLRIDPPAKATGLDATDYYEDQIVVSWNAVTDTGGAEVLWYCLGVASSPTGPFDDLANTSDEEEIAACLEAEEAADADDINIFALLELTAADGTDYENTYASQTVAIAAEDADGDAVTSFTHDGLAGGDHDDNEVSDDLPHEIELRYRLYAVTDQDGDPESTEDRKIARAASETATGRTVRPSDMPDPLFDSPLAVGNLRAVVYNSGELVDSDNNDPDNPLTLPVPTVSNQGLHFFWTHPDGFDPDYNDDDAETDPKVPHWYVEVQRRVAADADHDDYPGWQFVTRAPGAAPLAAGYGTAQFTVTFGIETENLIAVPRQYVSPVLWGPSKDNMHIYRVRYVNPGKDDVAGGDHNNDILDDDVAGAWKQITIPQVTTNYLRSTATAEPDEESTLPIILQSMGNTGTGLRFEYNDDSPRDARDHIDLLWNRDENKRDGQDEPNGYVIDRSPDDGATWETLRRADTPNDLGTADTFTDNQDVTPGHKYTYRVFPVFIESGPDAYGIPALIEANSRGADLPGAARSVRAVGDGQNACLVTWRAPSDNGGHPVRGYLIQMAPDEDGSPGTFVTIDVVGGTPPFTVMGGDTTEFKYTGAATQVATEDELPAGAVRWFRVIPVTNENDGVTTTGGTVLNEEGGPNTPRNDRATNVAALPLMEDYTRADPDKCTTDGLGDAPDDQAPAAPKMPVDLTSEAASDTNSLGDSDRGVFLTWNMQPQGDASEITSYQIQRIRMNTGVPALNDEADDWQHVTRVSAVTSYTDDTALRQEDEELPSTETRMYRVCSEASGVTNAECVEMAVDYGLHPPMHDAVPPELAAPAITSADGNASGEVEVTWTPGTNADGHLVMLFTDDFVGDPVVEAKSATDTMYTFIGVADGDYVVVVVSFDTDFDFQFVFTTVSVPGGS